MKNFKTLLLVFVSIFLFSCEEDEEVVVSDIINDWVAVSITDPNGEAVEFSTSGCYAQTTFSFQSDKDFSTTIKTPATTEAGGCDAVEYSGTFELSEDEKSVSVNKSFLLKGIMGFDVVSASSSKVVIKLTSVSSKLGEIATELGQFVGYTYTLEPKL